MVIRCESSWLVSAVLVIVGSLGGVAGCGGSSVRSEGEGDGSGQTGVGGTNAGGTNVGGTSPGGAGPGAAGAGVSQSCARPLPDDATVGCDWRAALGDPGQSQSGYCSKGGCHNASIEAGRLDLTPNEFLAARLLDVPAKHYIDCTGAIACDADVPTCEKCSKCVLGEVLISTAAPGAGAMFDRMDPFVPGLTTSTFSVGCGDAMPTFNTTGTSSYTQENKDCLIRFFRLLASTPGTWPCQER